MPVSLFSVSQGCACMLFCSWHIFMLLVCVGLPRILELTDTLKHLQSQNSEKDTSLKTMQISLDRMVGFGEPVMGGCT